jgi:hypothetical protein
MARYWDELERAKDILILYQGWQYGQVMQVLKVNQKLMLFRNGMI